MFSDMFDMAISLLQLERDAPPASPDVEPEEEDVFDRIQGALKGSPYWRRRCGWGCQCSSLAANWTPSGCERLAL
jgi:hypothetical protein